jgi:hypothetical protein
MTVFVYANTNKQIGDRDHIKIFANVDASETTRRASPSNTKCWSDCIGVEALRDVRPDFNWNKAPVKTMSIDDRHCEVRLERDRAGLGHGNGARHEALTATIAAPNVGNSAIGQEC